VIRVKRLYSRLQTERASDEKVSPHVRIVKNHLRLPDPDAFFFNAILDISAAGHDAPLPYVPTKEG